MFCLEKNASCLNPQQGYRKLKADTKYTRITHSGTFVSYLSVNSSELALACSRYNRHQ